MRPRGYEDFPKGTQLRSRPLRVTAEAILEFGKQFDPQVFHLAPEEAKRTLFAGLAASGWHTAAVSMRLFVETMNVAGGIIGMAVDELRWPNPVRPGDEVTLEIEVLKARTSRSRPGFGIIRVHNVTKNQSQAVVQSFSATALLPMRRPISVTDRR